MQYTTLAILSALASVIVADQTFSLTAKGDGIDTPVSNDGTQLFLNNGDSSEFTLSEPDGYLSTNGKYVELDPKGIFLVDSTSQASKDFGVEDGKLRSGPSSDKFDFYACPNGDHYNLSIYDAGGCTLISLNTDGATIPPSSSSVPPISTEAPTSSEQGSFTILPITTTTTPESSIQIPSSYSNITYTTFTSYSTDVVTITSCPETVTDCPLNSVTTTVVPIVITTTWCPPSSSTISTTNKPPTTTDHSTTSPNPSNSATITTIPDSGASKYGVGAAAIMMAAAIVL